MKTHSSIKHGDQTVVPLVFFSVVCCVLKPLVCVCLYTTDEIIMHEGVTAVYKVNVDLFFCVLGAQNENEVL